jgi:hypothetical protein
MIGIHVPGNTHPASERTIEPSGGRAWEPAPYSGQPRLISHGHATIYLERRRDAVGGCRRRVPIGDRGPGFLRRGGTDGACQSTGPAVSGSRLTCGSRRCLEAEPPGRRCVRGRCRIRRARLVAAAVPAVGLKVAHHFVESGEATACCPGAVVHLDRPSGGAAAASHSSGGPAETPDLDCQCPQGRRHRQGRSWGVPVHGQTCLDTGGGDVLRRESLLTRKVEWRRDCVENLRPDS